MNDVAAFRARVEDALARCRENLTAFEADTASAFSERLVAFDRLLAPLNGLAGRVGLFVSVHPDAAMRQTCEELEQDIARLHTSIGLDREIYARLAELEPPADATAEERRLLEHALRDFRRSGVDRDDATRERIRALQEEIVEVGQTFDRNIITGGRDVVVPEGHARLGGLPQDFLDAHPEREDGSVLLTSDPTDRFPVMTYAHDEALRREYSSAYANRAYPENEPVLVRLLAKRHELATLLGYEHWADYVTEDKMTTSAAKAHAFLDEVVELVRERAALEHARLGELKRAAPASDSDHVRDYDRLYLVERWRQEEHDFDSQELRPYLAYANVRDGVLATSAELYGVSFVERTDLERWHPSVQSFDVVDQGEVVARFHLDMHPREEKYKHAAMFDVSVEEGDVLPEAVLVCNFPEPTDDDPALLLHDQLTTFFHEFGHLLHHLFAGRQRFLGFAGIATEWDFVEVPSQAYEEWAWSHEVLARFAHHVETGEAIPRELVERMRRADACGRATEVLGQLFYAKLSLSYYDRDPATFEPLGLLRELRSMLFTPHEEGTHFHVAFGHLNGYSALYYTYLWSLVIAKDVVGAFEGRWLEAGVARRYREAILAPGGSRDAAELVRAFLGRDYAFDAFAGWLAAS